MFSSHLKDLHFVYRHCEIAAYMCPRSDHEVSFVSKFYVGCFWDIFLLELFFAKTLPLFDCIP